MEGSKRRKRKNDRIDANKLARLGRVDPQSLHPMQHRSREVRQDLVVLRARDALVAARTELINATRGLVKSMGSRLPKCSSPSFAQKVEETVPVELRDALMPLVRMAAALSDCIQGYDEKIEKLGREKYEHTALLRQVKGVGPITSLAYVLTLENPDRFLKSRDVGPYLGLVPKRALYFGTIRTRHGLTTIWAATLRAGREECEEESGGSGGPEARRLTALPLGEWRSI
jgi:transposase